MARSVFGWDLPPGCTQRMIDDQCGDDGVTALQDKILELLEAADIAEPFCDAIMSIVAQGEIDRCNREDAAVVDQLVQEHEMAEARYLEQSEQSTEKEPK